MIQEYHKMFWLWECVVYQDELAEYVYHAALLNTCPKG